MTRERTRKVLMVLTAVVAGLGIVGMAPAVFVPSMFGFPDAHGDWLTSAAVVVVIGFPLVCAASIIASWLLWRGNRDTGAWICMVGPPSIMLGLFIILLWLSY